MTELETKTGAEAPEATEQFTEATDGLSDEALDRRGSASVSARPVDCRNSL